MNLKNIFWNDKHLPEYCTIADILYTLRHEDKYQGLLWDAVTLKKVLYGFKIATLDNVITPFAKLETVLQRMKDKMDKVKREDGLPQEPEITLHISEPYKQHNNVLGVVSIFDLFDGQTITIFWHHLNQSDTPSTKILGTDTIIAWRWLLNKKDITQTLISPDEGHKSDPLKVAIRAMNLAYKNSAMFMSKNKGREQINRIDELRGRFDTLATEIKKQQEALEIAKNEFNDRARKSAEEEAKNAAIKAAQEAADRAKAAQEAADKAMQEAKAREQANQEKQDVEAMEAVKDAEQIQSEPTASTVEVANAWDGMYQTERLSVLVLINGMATKKSNNPNVKAKATAKLKWIELDQSIRDDIEVLMGEQSQTIEVPDSLPIETNNDPTSENQLGETKTSTSDKYVFDANRTKGMRKQDNANAIHILKEIEAGKRTKESLTEDDKKTLAKYSGTGGGFTDAEGNSSSAYEYYTPKPIAEGAWDLLKDLGFNGGKVLDPCAGTGIFGAVSPSNAIIDAIELDKTASTVCSLVNQQPGFRTVNAPFEKIASETPDEMYDAVVANVPFGQVCDRGTNSLLDSVYQDEPIQNYFILRSLEKLKPGGLAVFIAPPRCVSDRDHKSIRFRTNVSYIAEFLGAYRLPNSVFQSANADTITDIIAFRKFSSFVLDKIQELKAQSPETLNQSQVLWDTFTEGYYFKEYKKFILGEFIPKSPKLMYSRDRVENPKSIPEIAQMLRKFGASRIDWKLLDATETESIVYNDGDCLNQNGKTLQLENGLWKEVVTIVPASEELNELLAKCSTPYDAWKNQITLEDILRLDKLLTKMDRHLDRPQWLDNDIRIYAYSIDKESIKIWQAGLLGLVIEQLLEKHNGESISLIENYPDLAESIRYVPKVKATKASGALQRGIKILNNHYDKKTGFSKIFNGEIAQKIVTTVESTPDSTYEGLCYKNQSMWIDLSEAKKIYGDNFDPYSDNDWCISADGKQIIKAENYYAGSYDTFLKKIDSEISIASNDTIKQKLIRQKIESESRIKRLSLNDIKFDLTSPYVSIEEKLRFLQAFVSSKFEIVINDEDGFKEIKIPNASLDEEKLANRLGQYLKHGTVTLGNTKTKFEQDEALTFINNLIIKANVQFNVWVRAQKDITNSLQSAIDNPTSIHFVPKDNNEPLAIPGLNPKITLKGYQNAFIRRMATHGFNGINGFDTGLGKTFTALASVQHLHAMGIKKKTIFVVPKSVITNWKQEVKKLYLNINDCLFIGLRPVSDDKEDVKSSEYEKDLDLITTNQHAKIFMTREAFQLLRLKQNTVDKYVQHLMGNDKVYGGSSNKNKKEVERNESKQKDIIELLTKTKSAAPYLEDLGVDSLVIDEAHGYKNSVETFDLKQVKFLPEATPSNRGLDMQAKAWYIRGASDRQDGVLGCTATPITNSPVEVFSMLSITVGLDAINSKLLGIKGADDFLHLTANVIQEENETIVGDMKMQPTLIGLQNPALTRSLFTAFTDIKDITDVGGELKIPESPVTKTKIQLPKSLFDRVTIYKDAYLAARELVRPGSNGITPEQQERLNFIANYFQEPIGTIAAPFNLLNKMSAVILDPELGERATFFYCNLTDKDKMQSVIEKFNAKKIKEKRKLSPHTKEKFILKRPEKDEEGFYKPAEVISQAMWGEDTNGQGTIIIDTTSVKTQQVFLDLVDKSKIGLDVTVPPKFAALIENINKERANPRGIDSDGNPSNIVKQIIFCDMLPVYAKLKMILNKQCGIPSNKIAIITGAEDNGEDELIDVQNKFNAYGEENGYSLVIANKSGEVGINLQNGTQAIHHLTIGWTPDSLQQRNGRGVRQGNKTEKVNIYYYDAEGTFDAYKRNLVNKKSDWINTLLKGKNNLNIDMSGHPTKEEQEALLAVMGNEAAMEKIEAEMAANEVKRKVDYAKQQQQILLDIIEKQQNQLRQIITFDDFLSNKKSELWELSSKLRKLRDKPSKNKDDLIDQYNLLDEKVLEANDNPDSSRLREEWIGLVSAGKQLIDDSTTQCINIGESTPGSFDKKIIDKIINNEAFQLRNGIFIFDKAFIVNNYDSPTPSIVRVRMSIGPVQFSRIQCVAHNVSWKEILIDKVENPFKIINPDDLEYSEYISKAAQIEDGLESGTLKIRSLYPNCYSDILPEVLMLRKTDKLVKFNNIYYKLPSPYYPIVFNANTISNKTPVLLAIKKEQDKIIVKRENNEFYVLAKDASSIEHNDYNSFTAFSVLITYLRANNKKLNYIEFLFLNTMRRILDLSNFVSHEIDDDKIRQDLNKYLSTVYWYIDWEDPDFTAKHYSEILKLSFVPTNLTINLPEKAKDEQRKQGFHVE